MNFKKILRGIKAKKNPEIIVSECVSGNIKEEILRDIANSEFSSAIEKIKNLGFNIKGKNLFEIENSLDIDLMNKWKKESEKIKTIRNYVERQIDMLNLKAIIRIKLMNVDASEFINSTVEGKFLKKNILSSINALEINKENFNSEGINNIIRATPYKDIFKGALDDYKESKSLEKLELLIEKASIEFGLIQNPLSLDYVLSYLKSMWFDVRNVRIILIGKKYKLNPEEIEKLIIKIQ
ncbi:MAG: V-type ATPase subunit, partial [Candidatus Altarchaeaceae archaeon]